MDASVDFELKPAEIAILKADDSVQLYSVVTGVNVIKCEEDGNYNQMKNSNVRDLIYGACHFGAINCLRELLQSFVIFEELTLRTCNLRLEPAALYFLAVNSDVADVLWELYESDPEFLDPANNPQALIAKLWHIYSQSPSYNTDSLIAGWVFDVIDSMDSSMRRDICDFALANKWHALFLSAYNKETSNLELDRRVFSSGDEIFINHIKSVRI